MNENASPTLAEGTTLAHYSVRSVLGSGGMGTVYLAEDTALDRPVALKVLRAEIAGDPDFVERFVREARAAARVSHPNLTHVYFVGTSEGRPYFAMEYCPGPTLETIAAAGPVPLERGIDLLVQAARGLAAAHGAGVVHRDVKPSNLLVLPDGTVKVADFGLAKSLRGDVKSTAGRIMGTPTYMSPEQVRGRPVDARADVYLLGLTAYFLFAGRAPFGATQVGELINDQLNSPLPDLAGVRPDLPRGLGRLLSRMCAKDPADRPASMGEVEAALEALRPRTLARGSFMARSFALALDMVFFVLLLGAVFGLQAGLERFTGLALPDLANQVLAALLLALSQVGLERWQGRTLGKWLMDLEVVAADGSRARRGALALRFLLRFPVVVTALVPDTVPWIGFASLGLQGLAWVAGLGCFLAAGGRTLSDLLTDTRVVYGFIGRPAPGLRRAAATSPAPRDSLP